jgi:hypothetical protein
MPDPPGGRTVTRVESVDELLAQAVLDLALPADQALANQRRGGRGPYQLAVEFDEAYTAYVANLDQLPTDSQFQSLQAIDAALAAMSGPANSELWTAASFENHPQWAEVRALARAAATQFEWSSV